MSGTPSRADVIVVGAGQAGISLAHHLSRTELSHLVIERDRPFASWRDRWEGFRANTPNWMNTLPMLDRRHVPGTGANAFATRDELVEYFDDCLRAVDPPLVLGTEVTGVHEEDDGWLVETGTESYRAGHVAICAGAMNTPRIPAFAARIPSGVPTLHSSQYVDPGQITTRNVLVVGSASSGMQIARLLAESGRFEQLHLARSSVLVLPRHVAGVPIHRMIHTFRLFDVRTRSLLGRVMYSGLETRGDPIMRPTPRDLARSHGVAVHGKLADVDGSVLRFADGHTLSTDDLTIVWCTGFRSDYSWIHPLDQGATFADDGSPIHTRGVVDGAPGLYFVGLRYQYTSASHDIYGVAQDAGFVADHIADRVRGGGSAGSDDPGTARPRRSPVAGGNERDRPLRMVEVPSCCVCGSPSSEVIARGWDFEYDTSPDVFTARRCRGCGTRTLNPRPDVSEFQRIYPPEYHSLDYSSAEDGSSLVHQVRGRLEAKRLLRYCDGIGADARILDVGCGDAFHLKLLRRYGRPTWTLEGVDIDPRAVETAATTGLRVHEGTIEELDLGEGVYDVVYTIQTVEHVAHPDKMLAAISRVLKPGGRLVIVTDNNESIDAGWFRRRYWGGYHFPRHWNLFNATALTQLAANAGLEPERMGTIVSPVNWVYSIHNALVDRRAPRWLIDRFTLDSPIALGVFTLLDIVLGRLGRGALLNAFFTKPRD